MTDESSMGTRRAQVEYVPMVLMFAAAAALLTFVAFTLSDTVGGAAELWAGAYYVAIAMLMLAWAGGSEIKRRHADG